MRRVRLAEAMGTETATDSGVQSDRNRADTISAETSTADWKQIAALVEIFPGGGWALTTEGIGRLCWSTNETESKPDHPSCGRLSEVRREG